jgi:enoyl-CoA hydratase/carnithine racemase
MSDAGGQVKVEVMLLDRPSGRTARVVINNERRLNCLSTALIVELTAVISQLAQDRELRAVVLTGAGDKAFIGGADLNELATLNPDSARLFITRLHQACQAIRECPVPVLASINGYCLGAGLEVAACCDWRAAADSARFGMPEVQMGLPSVIEAALLPGLIGWGRTRELLLTGTLYSAAEAANMGLVERVAPAATLEAVIAGWLEAICRATPAAIRAQKSLLNRWQRVSIEEGIFAGIDALADAYKTGEPQAAIGAFLSSKPKA